MPCKPSVDDPLQKFVNKAAQTNQAVAGRFLVVVFPFWDGSYGDFIPDCWYDARRTALVVNTQQETLCFRAEVFQHFVSDSIRSRSLLLLYLLQHLFELSEVRRWSKPALAVSWSTARVWVLTSLTLSADGASVNSRSVIKLSFKPASVRILSSTFQTAFLSSRMFWSFCWTKAWRSAEPFFLTCLLHWHLWGRGWWCL